SETSHDSCIVRFFSRKRLQNDKMGFLACRLSRSRRSLAMTRGNILRIPLSVMLSVSETSHDSCIVRFFSRKRLQNDKMGFYVC
ncbi:MAG: hypothetical protein K2H55_07355, partial [Helicobacter sp.]|nr:hypothetical protein [Helicobacter sp.]